jgi:hypothetical protein
MARPTGVLRLGGGTAPGRPVGPATECSATDRRRSVTRRGPAPGRRDGGHRRAAGVDPARDGGTDPAERHVGRTAPARQAQERLVELKTVVDLLRAVLRDESARLWLRSPNQALDYEKPIDLVGRGEYRRVVGTLRALAEGVMT